MLRTALFRGVLFLGWSFLTVEEEVGGGDPKVTIIERVPSSNKNMCVCIAEKICGWVPISGEGRKSLRATLAQPAHASLPLFLLSIVFYVSTHTTL